MSTALRWSPRSQPVFYLSDALKLALRKRWNLGMLGSIHRLCLSGADRMYLEGLRDAGIEDAQKLLDAIEKHGEIEVWEEG